AVPRRSQAKGAQFAASADQGKTRDGLNSIGKQTLGEGRPNEPQLLLEELPALPAGKCDSSWTLTNRHSALPDLVQRTCCGVQNVVLHRATRRIVKREIGEILADEWLQKG